MKAKKKKTTKKAVTLLTRIETMLSDVLDECSEIGKSVEKNVRVLLRSAEASVSVAKEFFTTPEAAKGRQKAAKAPKRVVRSRAARTSVKSLAAAHRRSVTPARKRPALAKREPQASPPVPPAAISAL